MVGAPAMLLLPYNPNPPLGGELGLPSVMGSIVIQTIIIIKLILKDYSFCYFYFGKKYILNKEIHQY